VYDIRIIITITMPHKKRGKQVNHHNSGLT